MPFGSATYGPSKKNTKGKKKKKKVKKKSYGK